MSGAATTSVLFTSHELELLIEAVTNLAIEMDPINSEEAMIRDELAAMEYDLREALERVGVQPTPVTAEWDDTDETVAWASTEDHFIDLGIQAREQLKQLNRDQAHREERRMKAIRAEHDDVIHKIFGEFQVAK